MNVRCAVCSCAWLVAVLPRTILWVCRRKQGGHRCVRKGPWPWAAVELRSQQAVVRRRALCTWHGAGKAEGWLLTAWRWVNCHLFGPRGAWRL